ncbi:MAG: energy-coupling factor transporter ATPase [Clostridia bacterium]|nr:energy-coupling factor transporter ATPase [Clostridia bacterium]
MQIKAEELKFVYGKGSSVSSHALNGVNLLVEEGEFYGIIGKTGSGKSTFIQHINGLLKVQKESGKIVVGEFDLTDKKCNFKNLRKKVGMVFQYPEYQLFAETVFDDVAFGIKNFMPETSSEHTTELVQQALELVGLDYDQIKDKSPFELSGGQKRRVAIAGVIVTKPEVLVLDEPVAGLDPKGKREFLTLLHSLNKSFVKTVIIVSHDMNVISENCTKVAVFKDGKVVLEGSPEQVYGGNDIIEVGLSKPVTQNLIDDLNKVGVKIDSGLSVESFTDSIARVFGGRK